MITVKVEGIEELTRGLNEMAQLQVPFATALALTRTARKAKSMLYGEMRSKFDRPSPFVVPGPSFEDRDNMGSMRVEQATKERLFAVVKMKDWTTAKQRVATDPLLRHHFYGGARVAKGMELWFREKGLLAAGEYLTLGRNQAGDRYGNLGMAMWNKMIAQLGLTGGNKGYSRDASNKRGSQKSQAAAGTIFWSAGPKAKKMVDLATGIEYGFPGKPGRHNNLPKGVWVRDGKELHAVLAVVSKAPTYQQRFDLQKIATDAVRMHFREEFKGALKDAMKNSGYKGKWRR